MHARLSSQAISIPTVTVPEIPLTPAYASRNNGIVPPVQNLFRKDVSIMSDPTKKADDASARFNRAVSETTERLEKEAADFVKYVNDSVVPNVRQQSTKALRMAAQKLQQLANYMEHHSTPAK